MLHDLTAKVERLGEQERLRTLGDLDSAALLLARAARALLDPTVADSRVRPATFGQVSRSELETAIARVHAIVAHPGDRVAAGMRTRYPHIRRFLPTLLRQVTFDATTAADPALAAIKHLAAVEDGKAALSDAPTGHVGRHWTALVFRENGTLDAGAYTLCTLDALRLAIRRRDVFVPDALRWGDPRRLLLDKTSWKRNGVSVKRALDLDGGPRRLLARLGRELDDAYAHAGEVVTDEPGLLAADRTHERFKVPPLDAEPLPASTELLRDQIAALIPTSELPEVLLEVDAWTGFTQSFLPAAGTARSPDLALSICAALLVQACNVPYTAVSRRDVPALTEARLKWVEANYLRSETVTAANTRLVDHQAGIPLARQWGGGELTSADGLRFVVPVRSIHAGPNPRYFGPGRGITLFNYVADNYLGWASIVVTGTARDSQFLLDRILDNPTSLNPTEIVTDTASASDLNFGLCQLLGYRYMPRLAELPDRRLFRIHPSRDYGPLNPLAHHRINIGLIRDHWDDICRVVGTGPSPRKVDTRFDCYAAGRSVAAVVVFS
ncbi:Tn3 family transposase [Jatrophihabitans lederbergiae]|uniref:Tn3 family transposase n=1 Tax=Jatrophihabitans lederbergiae TaxID=3075547 RepID=A0ABU2JGM4_9ACTN|nr:Tn3 family transposase [Jatrophihabitans sp. DSM 44399]MDT0264147.1 Tn3 family transposase [Jatrophihabitans sp. DSM 44399]